MEFSQAKIYHKFDEKSNSSSYSTGSLLINGWQGLWDKSDIFQLSGVRTKPPESS